MGRFDEETYSYLSVKEYFADLINAGCFGGKRVVAAEDLTQLPERTQVEGKKGRKSLYRDLRMQLKNGTTFLLLAVENHSYIDRELPFRSMQYDAAEYKKQIDVIHRKKRKLREKAGLKGSAWAEKMGEEDKLQPIYTVCFYHGAGKWDGPKSLKDVMNFGENSAEWEKRFSDYKITVINAEDAEVAKNCRTEVRQFLDVMAMRRNRKGLLELLGGKAYTNLSRETARIIAVMADVPKFLENEEEYRNQEGEGYNMCLAMEELKEEFRAEGRAEGREQTVLINIKNLMKSTGWTLEQAMNALMISNDKKEKYSRLLGE